MKTQLVAIAAMMLPTVLFCQEAIANATRFIPASTNPSTCVVPTSIQIVDRVSRLALGQSPAQIEQTMGRSDQGYVRFNRPSAPEVGTMTWTQTRGSRKIEVRVSFSGQRAMSRSVAMIQNQGTSAEIFCGWSIESN